MTASESDDDIAKLRRHCRALEAELDEIWQLFGMMPPNRLDSGGVNVHSGRDQTGRRVIDRGSKND
jgi:hypothetical protein